MGQYEDIGPDKSAEEILRNFGNTQYQTGFPQVTSYVLAVAQVRNANEAIRAQQSCTDKIVIAVDALTASIKEASAESSDLGKKIVWLTVFLVAVGVLQAVASGWPYLAWWWHHGL